jgi:hypothetical protein
LAAGLAEIEKERTELLAKAAGRRDQKESRARQLLARMPELVRVYRTQVQRAIAVLAKPEAVEDARESTRRRLVDGRITLAPSPERTAVAGPVQLKELGEHTLELAGWQRRCKPSDSGGPASSFIAAARFAFRRFQRFRPASSRRDETPCNALHWGA